jgi:hypothetical protein
MRRKRRRSGGGSGSSFEWVGDLIEFAVDLLFGWLK